MWLVYLFGFLDGRGRESERQWPFGIRVKDDVESCVLFYGTLFGYRTEHIQYHTVELTVTGGR